MMRTYSYGFLALLLVSMSSGGGCESPTETTDPPPATLQIAFHSGPAGNKDIYVINADGSDLRKLTDHPAGDVFPSWSPDGKKIAFTSHRDGSLPGAGSINAEIYVMNADGSDLTRLTDNPGPDELTNNLTPKGFNSWSPDGTKILFARGGDIHVMDADGSNQRNLAFGYSPSWSPDGTRILFWSNTDGNTAIYVMDADGANQHNLTGSLASDFFPSWSPDGSRILFYSDRDGQGMYVMEADGSNQVRLTDHPTDAFASWSPDGGRIAFVSERDLTTSVASSELGAGEIYVMNADGSNMTRLTDNSEPDLLPSWSPDGQQIVFMSQREEGFGIYVMDSDGMNERRLTGGDGPAWSPVPSSPGAPTRPAFPARMCCSTDLGSHRPGRSDE